MRKTITGTALRSGTVQVALAIFCASLALLQPLAKAQVVPKQPEKDALMNAVVQTENGRLQGVSNADVAIYRGIPYAAAPIGTLRWRAPEPVQIWQGIRNATEFGDNCSQPENTKDNGIRPGPSSEDCLTLNVWTPATAPVLKRAVMVWIHGGSFTGGSGSAALYDGTALAKRGVVVVTMNYRLGRFGFFAHPLLAADPVRDVTEPQANYGLLDQIAALAWVKRNIQQFGGDPSNVTLFGESAGGAAVNYLMLAPAARGLFAKVVIQSGRGMERLMTLPEAAAQGMAFTDSLGLKLLDAKALRAIPAEVIAAAPLPSIYSGFGPILDGKTVVSNVWEGWAASLQVKVPAIIGFNSDELPLAFLGDTTKLDARMALSEASRAAAMAAYGGEANFKRKIFGDYFYAAPALKMAQAHAKSGAPTYAYQFSHVSKVMRGRLNGAPHASDRQYIFGTLRSSPWPTDAEDVTVSELMMDYWTSFAKTGVPSGAVAWPAINTTGHVLDIQAPSPVVRSLADVASPLVNLDALYR